MRKNIFGRKFKRDVNERKALFKGLLSSLVLNERIKTTEQKAKAIKAEADKLVTKAKKEEPQARKLLARYLTPSAMDKMLSVIGPGFKERNSGYTRIVRLGNRFSDNASVVMMEWVERAEIKNEKLNLKNEEKSLKKGKKVSVVKSASGGKTKSKLKKEAVRKSPRKVRKTNESNKA